MQVTNKIATRGSNREMTLRVLRRIAIDGILGATCGGLYGLVFGGFRALLVHGEPWKLVSIAVYFAGWGFALGALVGAPPGASSAVDAEPGDSVLSSPNFVEKKQLPIEAVRHIVVPSQRSAENTLVAATATELEPTLTVGT